MGNIAKPLPLTELSCWDTEFKGVFLLFLSYQIVIIRRGQVIDHQGDKIDKIGFTP